MSLRRFLTIFTTLAFAFTLTTGDALAKKKKKGDDAAAEETQSIQKCGIKEFDDVFMKAKAIHDTLDGAQAKLAEANTNIATALGVAEGTPLADALAELKTKAEGKISLAMDGTMPKLSAEEWVPEGITTALDGVNGAVANVSAAVEDLTALAAQAKELTVASKDFPSKLNSQLLKSNDLKVTQLFKVVKTVGSNVKAISKTPARVETVTDELKGFLQAFTDAFKAPEGEAPAE
jgi:hypothetical protein